MSLSAVSSSCSQSTGYQSGLPQRRSEVQQLSQALQSGDLSGAQKAYNALTQNSSSQSAQSNQNSPLAQDFTALGKALQSGDLSSAQQAFAKLRKDASESIPSSEQSQVSGTKSGHRYRHDLDSYGGGSSASTSPVATSSEPTQDEGATTGTIINVTG